MYGRDGVWTIRWEERGDERRREEKRGEEKRREERSGEGRRGAEKRTEPAMFVVYLFFVRTTYCIYSRMTVGQINAIFKYHRNPSH